MRRYLTTVLSLALIGCSSGAKLEAADQGVTRFHAQLGAGQYDAIYEASGPEFKAASKAADMEKMFSAVSTKLGKLKSSERQSWNVNYNMNGSFVNTSYLSKFDRGEATETFIWKIEEKKAKLVGYNINSAALIIN